MGIDPVAVVGHSSGEIAAAYASGYLTMDEAITIAYYRGYVADKQTLAGAMAAVGMGSEELSQYLTDGVVVACENSPESSTISGDLEKVNRFIDMLNETKPDVFSRALKVDVAYHSCMCQYPNTYLPLGKACLIPENRSYGASQQRV